MKCADGLVINDLTLRRDLTEAIRRHQPEVIIGMNYRQRWGSSGPWNHVDHRGLGAALPDAVRDAANRWLFVEAGERWDGVDMIAYASSTEATHVVDVAQSFAAGVSSLECHRTYIDALGDPEFDPDSFLRAAAKSTGASAGLELAVAFEVVPT